MENDTTFKFKLTRDQIIDIVVQELKQSFELLYADYADSTKCDDWGNEEYLAMCSIRDTISYNMIPQEFIKYIAGFPKAADAQWPTSSDFSDPEYDISDDEDDDFIEPSFCVNDALDNLGQTSKDIQMIRDKWADFSEEEELVRDLSAASNV